MTAVWLAIGILIIAAGLADVFMTLLQYERFPEVEQNMHALAKTELGAPSPERYERYSEWLSFAGRARNFVELASRDLGIDPQGMYEDPGRAQL